MSMKMHGVKSNKITLTRWNSYDIRVCREVGIYSVKLRTERKPQGFSYLEHQPQKQQIIKAK